MLSCGKARMIVERLVVEFLLWLLFFVPATLLWVSAFRRQLSWPSAIALVVLEAALYAYSVWNARRDLELRYRRETYGPSPLAAVAPVWLEHEWYLHNPPTLPPPMSLVMKDVTLTVPAEDTLDNDAS